MATSRGVARPSADGLGIGLYSVDDLYRYWFLTPVDPALRPGDVHAVHRDGLPTVGPETLVWVGFNPSRGDDDRRNRVALRNVLYWAERAGLEEVLVVNLYAYRHTDPKEIKRWALRGESLDEMIGQYNDDVLRRVAEVTTHALLAWGSYGAVGGRGAKIAQWFPHGWCVGTCRNEEPFHPARKRRALTFSRYRRLACPSRY